MAKGIMDFWKQAAADITDTSNILDTSAILDTRKILDTSELLGMSDDAEENLDDNNIILRVFCTDPYHKNSQIKENEIVYISSEPKMPNLNIEIEISNYFNAVKYGEKLNATLEIKYSVDQGKGIDRKFRNDTQRYPINQNFVFNVREQSIFFKYDKYDKRIFKANILPTYSEVFRGGAATLKVFNATSLLLKTFTFQIRGINPSKPTVKAYLKEKGHDSFWFFYKILVRESQSKDFEFIQQFYDINGSKPLQNGIFRTEGINYSKDAGGTPVWGRPDGWGIGQIDNSQADIYTDSNVLWNWKLNIEEIMNQLLTKIDVMVSAQSTYGVLHKINSFKSRNKDKVINAPNIKEGLITYIQAPTSITGLNILNQFFEGTLGENQKSIIDAHLIRAYNGGYFLSKIEVDKDGNGLWIINDSSNQSGNYVEDISNITE